MNDVTGIAVCKLAKHLCPSMACTCPVGGKPVLTPCGECVDCLRVQIFSADTKRETAERKLESVSVMLRDILNRPTGDIPLTLSRLQMTIAERWGTASYQEGVSQEHHAILHLVKAVGKVAAALEESEHVSVEGTEYIPQTFRPAAPQMADVVICIARLADLWGLSLESEVNFRIANKFPVRPVDKF